MVVVFVADVAVIIIIIVIIIIEEVSIQQYLAMSNYILSFQPFPFLVIIAILSHIQQLQQFTAIYSHLKLFPVIYSNSSHLQPFSAHFNHSSYLQPLYLFTAIWILTAFLAIDSSFLPFPTNVAISSNFQLFQPFQADSSHIQQSPGVLTIFSHV